MLSLASCGHFGSKPARSVPANDSTVQCHADCVAVSKAFIKEHADLYDEVIRLRAALKLQQEKH